MAKILKNLTASPILIGDTGVSIPASPSTYSVVPMDFALWAASSDIVTYIGNGSIVVNDGTYDLSKADGISLVQGNFKQSDFIPTLKDNNRLKVDVQFSGDQLIKVSSDDQTSGYLESKISVEAGALTETTLNPGAAETLQIGLATISGDGSYGSSSLIPTFTKDTKGRVTNVVNVSVDKLYDHWNGTTQYRDSQLRRYTTVGTTNSSGRVTVNLTTTGLVGGPALFSQIFNPSAIGVDNSNVAIQSINMFIESISATQVVFRATRGTSVGVLLGGTVVSTQFAGAGHIVYIEITGVKA